VGVIRSPGHVGVNVSCGLTDDAEEGEKVSTVGTSPQAYKPAVPV